MVLIIIFTYYALEFLKELPDAKGVSLGFSDISENNINLTPLNPSLIPDFISLNFGTQNFALLANYYLFGFSLPFKNIKTGFLWIRTQIDEIPEYPFLEENDTIPKLKTGEFSSIEEAFLIPFKFKKLNLAFQFKLINKRFKDLKGKGIGFDLGFKKDFKLKGINTYLGISLIDPFGTKILWNRGSEDKENIKILTFLTFKKNLKFISLALSGKIGYDIELLYSSGMEIKIKDIFSILAGYDREPRFGAGFVFKNFEIYYSLRIHELGLIEVINLSIKK
ncbi:MAG: hypothetical protein ABIM58_03505 [candidate division WOR-3 bacterium]